MVKFQIQVVGKVGFTPCNIFAGNVAIPFQFVSKILDYTLLHGVTWHRFQTVKREACPVREFQVRREAKLISAEL